MAKLPIQSSLDQINNIVIENYPRPHLGASQIGSPCKRYLVYSFYWTFKKKIPGKLNQIFSMGDGIEDIIVDSLKSVGIKHYGSQQRVIDDTGHGGGSIDGIVSNVPGFETEEELLFEAKSMNHTNFLDVKRKGVEESKPVYYAQMQMYMGRLDLKFGMFVSMDKNTSELYMEFIPFDEDSFDDLECIEYSVITATNIGEFPRISNNPTWFQCKFCDAKDICQSSGSIESNCRTCNNVQKQVDGEWYCVKRGNISSEEQETPCDEYCISDMW